MTNSACFCITEYGHRDRTVQCIASIEDLIDNPYIVVGDDHYVKNQFELPKSVHHIPWPHNIGYTKNTNRTVKWALDQLGATGISTDDIILFVLNNDLIFEPSYAKDNAITRLAQFARENDCVVGPTIAVPDIQKCTHETFVHGWHGKPKATIPTQFTMLSGCCLVMKAKIWKEVGGLNERFELHYSDDAFCLDATKLGYPCMHYPDARIFHDCGTTVRRVPTLRAKVQNDRRIFRELYPDVVHNPSGQY
jgi:GT2 family glycosyltransferase